MSEREYFACVGRRRGTFVGTASSFHQLTAFLTGYDQHAMRHGGQGLWLCAREREPFVDSFGSHCVTPSLDQCR